MLQHFGVVPFLIFDGDYLPSKAATEADRSKRREDSRKAGLELLNAGKTSQAYLEFQKAVDVTPEMARQLIDELKKTGVQYIVAPYEADAQMVYLERKGILDGILSEDSDLLVFGAKCLLTKLDQYGNCIEINKADFSACKDITLTGWSDVEFRRMAILSGCDYLASINNMGLKTAYRMVRKHKTIEKVLRMLAFDGKFFVPKGYLEAFYQAEHTFLHQRVFCPKRGGLVLHTEPEEPIDVEQMPFIGAYVEPEIAQGVARGDLNPITKLPIVVESKVKMISPLTPTPWTGLKAALQRSATSTDLKKGKTIDTFLQPRRRVPLAELDINCFTPSPSQQDALRRNSGPWVPSPARPYLHRSSTEPIQQSQSVPAHVRTTARTHNRTPTISEPRPMKRARLCDDDLTELLKPGEKSALGRSRFFGASLTDPSPTVGKSSRNRRSKKEDITIFSDDSIEEAMLSLPDFDGFGNQGPKASKKITVFEEDAAPEEALNHQSSSSLSGFSAAIDVSTSQTSMPSMTQSTSLASSFEEPSPPAVPATNPLAKLKLKSRFSFNGQGLATPKSNTNIEALPTPVSSVSSISSRQSRIPLAVKSNAVVPRVLAFSKKSNLTPLQRLRTNANRSNSPMTPPLTPTYAPRQIAPRLSMLSKISVPFPEVVEKGNLQEVEPASISLPFPDEAENSFLQQNGSEDLIIPDSEDEGLSPIADDATARINIGRFVFAGV